jgi:hypothetical protein
VAKVPLRRLVRRAPFLAAVLLAFAAPSAGAADPIMPLAEVRPGMHCTGLSVIRGTEISSFDIEILDVIAQEAGMSGPRILVRASGPAVDATGIGAGFSGSPIICDGRNAGAISEALGEYGNDVVLATPIEEVLGDAPAPARGASRSGASVRRDRRLARAARALVGPLTVSGLSTHTRQLLARAAKRAGRTVLAAPAGPAAGYAPVDPKPGSAVAATISTGDVALGGIGTVAYRDGSRVWAFGHPLDALGRRTLFLQDSYVYGVISNPLGLPELGLGSYKLASSAGHVLGTFTNDGLGSVSGVVGTEPPSIPLTVVARGASGGSVVLRSQLADERPFGYGAHLSLVMPLAASQAIERLMRSIAPATVAMCTRFRTGELPRPIGFCNTYFDTISPLADLTHAGGLIDGFDLAPLGIESAEVSLRVRPGVVEDVLVDAEAPRRVRAGERIPIRLVVHRRRGGRRGLSGSLRLARSLRPGKHTLVLEGNSYGGFSEASLVGLMVDILIGVSGAAAPEPRSARELVSAVRQLHRPLGVEARLKRRSLGLVVRSDDVSYAGSVRLKLRVERARRASRRG